MAGGTKCYEVTKGEDGQPVKTLVSFSPKYAAPVGTAVIVVRNGGKAYVKPADWQAFEAVWEQEAR